MLSSIAFLAPASLVRHAQTAPSPLSTRPLRVRPRAAAPPPHATPPLFAPGPPVPQPALLPPSSLSPAPLARHAASTSPRLAAVKRARPWLLCALPALLLALPALSPALAAAAAPALSRSADPAGFIPALTTAFVLVLASEIGDKTFFISALLSMKYARVLVLVGTMAALGAMTIISVAIGQVFHALPASLNSSIPFDDYAAVALLLWFGFQNVRDALRMRPDEDEELQDAKDVVAGQAKEQVSGARVVAETSSLIFFAEWGDKSMLATVALAAAKSPWGVIVGGISGHFVASVIAVVGGSFLGKYISERNARLTGGILFFVFAILTVLGLY